MRIFSFTCLPDFYISTEELRGMLVVSPQAELFLSWTLGYYTPPTEKCLHTSYFVKSLVECVYRWNVCLLQTKTAISLAAKVGRGRRYSAIGTAIKGDIHVGLLIRIPWMWIRIKDPAFHFIADLKVTYGNN
jgi:hypothetical protein